MLLVYSEPLLIFRIVSFCLPFSNFPPSLQCCARPCPRATAVEIKANCERLEQKNKNLNEPSAELDGELDQVCTRTAAWETCRAAFPGWETLLKDGAASWQFIQIPSMNHLLFLDDLLGSSSCLEASAQRNPTPILWENHLISRFATSSTSCGHPITIADVPLTISHVRVLVSRVDFKIVWSPVR